MLTAAAMHGIDISLMWGTVEATRGGRPVRVRQVCLAVPGAGRTAMLLLSGPGPEPAEQEHAERVAAANAACEGLAALTGRDIRLAQALPEPQETWAERAFVGAGFMKVGELAYLRRRLEQLPTATEVPLPDGIEVRNVKSLDGARGDRGALIEALDRSYELTLDCPELCGLRDTSDVLDSHRATGTWDPRLWWIITLYGQPHGCMLLSRCPEHGSVELVYLGLSRELRGRRIGSTLLDLGLSRLAGVDADHIACAVDLRNVPAQRLYERAGFREFSRRVALVRPLKRRAEA